MTAGYSGSFGINGTNIAQPTTGDWEDKETLGDNGNGVPIYPATTEFTLSWGLMSTSQLAQLINLHLYTQTTGTVVVDLPEWGHAEYKFYSYSGTVIKRPSVGAYFSEWVEDVQLTISNIRVS